MIYSTRDFILILFSVDNDDEINRLILACDREATDYDARGWREVDRLDLVKESVKINLIRTLYQSQYGNSGVAIEIVQSMIEWTEERLIFNFLNPDDEQFYHVYFTFLCALNFENLRPSQQVYFLASRFFPFALVSNLPVSEHVTNYFARFCFTEILEKNAARLAAAISINNTPISQRTVAEWISEYKKRRDTYAVGQAGFTTDLALRDDEKNILAAVISLFEDLFSNNIWKNIDFTFCAHERVQKREPFDAEVDFLKQLSANSDIGLWLTEYISIARWLDDKSNDFVRDFFGVLSNKIYLQNTANLDLLLKLIDNLPNKHNKKFGAVIYFSEFDGQFHWNDSLISGEEKTMVADVK